MEGISMQLIILMFRFIFLIFCFRILIASVLRVMAKSNSIKKEDNITKENEQRGNNSDTGQDIKTGIPVVQMVKDELCGAHVQKEKAYIVVDNSDKRHYFCSWECRQEFIKTSGNIK